MLNRRYENPFTIEEELEVKRIQYNKLAADFDDHEDELVDLGQDIADPEERLNFAWQDDEAEAEGWE